MFQSSDEEILLQSRSIFEPVDKQLLILAQNRRATVALALGVGTLFSLFIPLIGPLMLFAAPVGVIFGIMAWKGSEVKYRVLGTVGIICSILAIVLFFVYGPAFVPGPPHDDSAITTLNN